MKVRICIILSILLAISIQAGIGQGQSQIGPLPVELKSFSAILQDNVVILNWTTATEVNNYGFTIQRKSRISNSMWEEIGFINGHGNSNSPQEYSFTDPNIGINTVQYRLKQIDTDGNFKYSSVLELNSNLFKEYVLEQNYPNPFNPSTVN